MTERSDAALAASHGDSGAAPAQAPPPAVNLTGIRKRYGPLDVLDGVDVAFGRGRVTAVLGPNGAGKTTLLKIVLGLVKPDEGRTVVDGNVVNGAADYRAAIGYMPQLPRFPGALSARDLMALLTDLRDFEGAPDDELIRAFALEDELDRPFRTLSGGTRQKVNAALAFFFGAPVLVLDEPTAGLDPVAARVLKDKVRRERDRGRTVLLTSHELAQVEALADDVIFLLEGRVRYAGSLADLLAHTGERDLEGAVASLLLHPCLEVIR